MQLWSIMKRIMHTPISAVMKSDVLAHSSPAIASSG
jgi:hypothetical protein